MWKKIVVFFIASVSLTGCRVDQQRETRVYRDVIDLKTDKPATRPGVATLADVLRLTNKFNRDLASQGEVYYRAVNQRRRAIANFLPTLNLEPTYVRRDFTGGGSVSGNNLNANQNAQNAALDVPLTFNINLFSGFADANLYWATTFRIEQQKQTLLDTQQTVLLDSATVYYAVLVSEASLNVIEQSLAVQEERLRDTKGRFDAGLARPLDVSQTEAQVAQTRVALIDARRDIDTGRTTLTQLASSDLNTTIFEDDFAVPEAKRPLGDYLGLAVAARNDLQAADAAVLAARRDVEIAVAQYYPSVTLDVSRFLYRESVPDTRRWDAILGANLPIFAAGRIRADVLEAWSFFRQAQIVRERVEQQVTADVQAAVIEFDASTNRLDQLKKQLTAAEEAFALAEQSYRAGLATNLDRVVAQSTLLTAQLGYAQEFFSRKLRYLNLLRACGTLRQELESW